MQELGASYNYGAVQLTLLDLVIIEYSRKIHYSIVSF